MMEGLMYSEQLEKFYEQDFNFSYSGINKLLFSPVVFYNHYILKEKEDRVDAHLVAGKAVHCLLLENDTFIDQFMITPGKMPTGKGKIVVDYCFKIYSEQSDNQLMLSDFEQVILDTLVSVDLYQSLKTDEQRVAKIITDLNKEYFNYLKLRDGKTLIDQEMFDNCVKTVEQMKLNAKVMSLLQLGESNTDTFKILNEEFLNMKLDNYDFGLKGVLDNVVIDYNNKLLFINDVKTTGKPIQDFADSVDYYNYWLQATIYKKLAIANYLEGQDISAWKVYITFIVVDKYNVVYPFQVSDETIAKWELMFGDMMKRVNYHYSNKDYTLPYELASSNFKL